MKIKMEIEREIFVSLLNFTVNHARSGISGKMLLLRKMS